MSGNKILLKNGVPIWLVTNTFHVIHTRSYKDIEFDEVELLKRIKDGNYERYRYHYKYPLPVYEDWLTGYKHDISWLEWDVWS